MCRNAFWIILLKRGFMLNALDEYAVAARQRLSQKRYDHCVNVSKTAARLAELYGADAEKARLAGILHDITKETPVLEQVEYIEKLGGSVSFLELNRPQVLHQRSGAAYCRLVLGVTDEEVLCAVRFHTTGRRGITLLEKVLFTADLVSPDREYPDVETVRLLAEKSLDDAVIYSLGFTLKQLAGGRELIHPDTLDCYDYLLEERIKESNGIS